ncbi:ALF repeat-containing protein [Streptomyces sp. QH1-20]|uniref:ALF repeat-containing protein n=1 Tax=Streptomyces sp. QH1-20 TaxID=3240934 RepID=UPI0035169B0D
MSRQWWVAQALTVSMLTVSGALAGAAPSWADAPVPIAVSTDQPSPIAAVAAENARNRVLKVAKSNLPAEVRVSAWNALRSSRGDAAIADWLAPGGGYDAAKQRMRTTRSRNTAFCERVVSTHPVEFSPEVRTAAERALKGSDTDRAAFVRTGYAEAQQRDRAAREADAQQRQEAAANDRAFVRALAEQDPGEQVRVAAQWALRTGATNADVVEFFGYGWVTGAALDLEGYRMRVADAEVLRHHTLKLLIEKATAAEQDLKNTADWAKARAEAEGAWRAVAEHADAAQKAWLAEQDTARAQAENWRNIGKAAKESADGLWKNIAGPADANQDSWAKEQTEAAGSAAFWKDMFDRAKDSENRMRG